MVAKTPEGISLENLSKRASVYIDPDCDLYLELQYLQSAADFNKCNCFDLHLLAPGICQYLVRCFAHLAPTS